MTAMITDAQTFIAARTRLRYVPFVSEIRLHLADDVTELWHELQEPLPFWAVAWVGGQAVARYLLDHPGEAAGKRVVDVAAGSGVCAIAAAKAGATSVLAVDVDPLAGDDVALNAGANGVEVRFLEGDLFDDDPPPMDLVLAGDVCYEEPLASRALSWLRLAHERGVAVLIGDPGREYFRPDGLVQVAEYKIPTTREIEGLETKMTRVYTCCD